MINCQCTNNQESYDARYKQKCEGKNCTKDLCSKCCSKEGFSQTLKFWCARCEEKEFGDDFDQYWYSDCEDDEFGNKPKNKIYWDSLVIK